MIKFFKNIRKVLINEGKTTNYLKYAIGEIILVVIGILIALQINNWNELRKQKLVERQILVDINNNILENIDDMYEGIEYNKTCDSLSEIILNAIKNKTPYSPDLNYAFGGFWDFWIPDFTDGAYINLKTQGLYMISNSSLRNEIIKLFEIELNRLTGYKLNLNMDYKNQFIDPLLNKYFVENWPNTSKYDELIPKDYEKVMNDETFYTAVIKILYRRQGTNRTYLETIEKAKETGRLIRLEINNISQQ